jgi:fumarate reductase flavoprotein subunit
LINRRQFIKGAGVVAVGVGLSGVAALETGCSPSGEGFNDGSAAGNGKVSAVVPGFNGDVSIAMIVDTENGLVSDVSIEGPYETADRGRVAVQKMQAAMNERGSIDVDTVSSATVTSSAILNAAAYAYNTAMGALSENAVMTPGTYEASSYGSYPGMPVNVSVTLSENSIDSIEIIGENLETVLMLRAAEDTYIPRIIENQALSVDAVSGATMTSSAIRLAVEQCVKDAYTASGFGSDAVYPWLKRADYTAGAAKTLDKDVVVIGLGGSGMAAALSAAESGLNVLAIEKAGKYGGTTCVTSESLAINPQRFKDEMNGGADFVDSAELMDDWYQRTHGDAKRELLDLFFAESGNTIDWLNYDHNWPFNPPNPGHADYAIYDCCFTYSPYTLAGPKVELAALIDGLMTQYESLGGEYLLETEVSELIYDTESNRVTGVKATAFDGQSYEINAKAVVLATGGFGGNSYLMNEYMIDDYFPLSGTWHLYGMATNDGAMIGRALDIGAGICNPSVPPLSHLAGFPFNLTGFGTYEKDEISFFTGHTAIWSEGDIPSTLSVAADSLAVNRQGERFINEEEFASHGAIKAGPEYYTIWSQSQLDEYKAVGLDYADFGPSMGYVGCQSTIPLGVPLTQLDEVM